MTLDENGSALTFLGGQPVMDGGIENAIFISLFTRKDPNWAGNFLITDPNQQIGSDFEETLNQPINFESLNNIRTAAEAALKWMVDSELASRVTANATNPTGTQIQIVVLVEYPGKDLEAFLANKFAENWIIQKIDPANLRV
ncbi:phage GP46 family protein [Candidatus Pacearchaeota archaeon]|nr:phage GP46 family protein [Candidatus Pacearchaeota archaeon]